MRTADEGFCVLLLLLLLLLLRCQAAGFTDVQIKRIGPTWYRGVRRHGLIMGCSVTGIKPKVRRESGSRKGNMGEG
jgi:hypothetical protein